MRIGAAALVAVVLLAGCGGESEEERVVDALAASFLEDDGFDDFEVSADEAECAAQSIVDDLGTERVTEIGIVGGAGGGELDLTAIRDDEIGVMAEAMETCIDDLDEAVVSALASDIREQASASFPVTEQEARCVAEHVADALSLSRLIVVGVRADAAGDAEENPFDTLGGREAQAVSSAYLACVDVRALILDQIEDQGVPEDVRTCLDDQLTDDDVAALFRATYAGDEADTSSEELLTTALEECV